MARSDLSAGLSPSGEPSGFDRIAEAQLLVNAGLSGFDPSADLRFCGVASTEYELTPVLLALADCFGLGLLRLDADLREGVADGLGDLHCDSLSVLTVG